MLSCLIAYITEYILPEIHCGFRKDQRTLNMIFAGQQIQEKCQEQNKDLTFIDLTKAFDIVNLEILCTFHRKFGVLSKFLCILQQFYNGLQACVCIGSQQSSPSLVNAGVNQGCVLAPLKFNLFLVAATILSNQSLKT